MIAIPSTYSKTYEKELIKYDFKVVIYANHLLRASYKAMHKTAKKILINQRAFEAEKNITSINEIISLIKL
jgi:phosphoenolpyruvate phosphomutase